MFKIKHARTADCVVAGYRVHKSGPDLVGSLMLGPVHRRRVAGVGRCDRRLPDGPAARAVHRAAAARDDVRGSSVELGRRHGGRPDRGAQPAASETSRWNAGKDLSFVPLRPELRRRGALRPDGGGALPAHRAVQPLAAGPDAAVVHVRPARAAGDVPARGHRARPRGSGPEPAPVDAMKGWTDAATGVARAGPASRGVRSAASGPAAALRAAGPALARGRPRLGLSDRAWPRSPVLQGFPSPAPVVRPALASAVLLVVVFPGNIHHAAAAMRSSRASTGYRAATLARLPVQAPLVAWALRVAPRGRGA